MTYEEYRQHMRKYSRDTAVMSFVVAKHPDYQALREAGNEIIPWLLTDMSDPDWHCNHCYGEGFEFPPNWVWDNVKRNWPTDTGIPCTVCKGKGSISSWACMMLVAEKAGNLRPYVEPRYQGKHDALVRIYREWGERNGYLPPTPVVLEPSGMRRLGRAIFGIFKLWGS